ncbi:VWA domain-containing protein [Cytobacillus massiliigabonensis]|uniref:VWA domain-containing protein n=1 Tax=Cytobacillus massiliigabonensis TaxID=1871011 RepID=UPI000C8525EB|nr:VWA domain-containing protein [Cytobacillus massiliigabonensis]
MGIEFKFPILFIFLFPVVYILFLYLKNERKERKMEARWIAGIRLIVFTMLILALTVPQVVMPINGETVIFLIDRSASVKTTENEAIEWIENSVNIKQKKDAFGVAVFGENVSLEQQVRNQKTAINEINSKIMETETNLEAGIQFAASLIPRDTSGRIVLLTDGNETTGDSSEAAKLLKNRKIELDYVLLKNQVNEDISLTELNVPPSLYKGEKAPVSFTINSNANKKAIIRLSANNHEILKETVDVKEGKNVYTFSHHADTSGLSVYKGEVSAENDSFIENNILHAITNVKGTPKVLIVQGMNGGNLESILSGSGVETETIPPEKLPTELSSFIQYQSIVFNNIPATLISEKQMNLIEKAVKEFGTGFVMAGGEESFGLGGYFKTPIEKLLPVDMDIKGKKEMPSLGLVIVMDRSGSMSGNKLALAKEAAARSVELLREEDTLGFIAFDDRPWVIVETNALKDKKKAADKIRSVTPGGGTEIYSSLEMAYEELEERSLQRKHIILLTDGQSSSGGDYESLIEEGKEKNITLSTVALGQDADRGLLEDLASMGTGRFYDVTDSSVIPSILSRETVMATRTYIEDHPFFPKIQGNPDLSPLFKQGVPKMNAYIATTPKSRAQVPISSEKDDPVLAEWQYGMGHTIAFTSDFSGKWSGDWAHWENWASFINQMVTKTLPQYESEPYRISIDKKNGNPIIDLESVNNQTLPIEAAIVSEDGEEIDSNTKLVAPGKYELAIPNRTGMFFLSVKQTDQNGAVHTYQTGFTLPYSDEYLLNGPNEKLLKELSNLTGGKELISEKDTFRPLNQQSHQKQPISQWLILTAFLLFFIEIAVRRFGLVRIISHSVNNKIPKLKEKEGSVQLKSKSHNRKQITANRAEDNQEKQDRQSEEKQLAASKRKKRKKPEEIVTPEERAERMNRLLEAKKRKN